MSTCQQRRPQQQKNTVGNWENVFPTEQVTEQQSCLFTKKLLAVAISNITYLRAIFPEGAYGDRRIGDVNLKILREEALYPGACRTIMWVKGCFDAIEKKYLRMLMIGIYVDPDDPDTVIESYTFRFTYSNVCGMEIYRNDQIVSSTTGTEQTKKETIRLLRTLIVLTQSLQPLPDHALMTMKIVYYDDVTPADYEPPGFKSSICDTFTFDDDPVNIKIGDVSTKFHNVKMRVKTSKQQFDCREALELVSETPSDGKTIHNSGLDKDQDSVTQQGIEEIEAMDIESVAGEPENLPTTSAAFENDPAHPTEEMAQNEDDICDGGLISCCCGVNEVDGLMIRCDMCKKYQHSTCFAILDEEHAPPEHTCDTCAKMSVTSKPTDAYLKDLSPISVQATCQWRKALVAVQEFDRLLPHTLASRLKIEASVAQGIIRRLETEGYAKMPTKDKRLGRVVLKEKLRTMGIPAYFRKKSTKPEDATNNQESEPQPLQQPAPQPQPQPPPQPQQEPEQQSQPKNPPKAKGAARKGRGKGKGKAKADQNKENCFLGPVTEEPVDHSTKMSDVVEKTAKISVTGSMQRILTPVQKRDVSSLQEKKQNHKQGNSARRGVKRVYSKIDQLEFEVSNSQEMTPQPRSHGTRQKCSKVSPPVQVHLG